MLHSHLIQILTHDKKSQLHPIEGCPRLQQRLTFWEWPDYFHMYLQTLWDVQNRWLQETPGFNSSLVIKLVKDKCSSLLKTWKFWTAPTSVLPVGPNDLQTSDCWLLLMWNLNEVETVVYQLVIAGFQNHRCQINRNITKNIYIVKLPAAHYQVSIWHARPCLSCSEFQLAVWRPHGKLELRTTQQKIAKLQFLTT